MDDSIYQAIQTVSFRDAVLVWARVAVLSFGGPAGQIAVMHRILVVEKRWIGEARFLHALNYCMLLPGPEAHELAIYIGWLLHRVRGGLVAGILFVLPGLVALTALSLIYAEFGQVPAIAAVFTGLKAAVLAIVLGAFLRIGKRVLTQTRLLSISLLAFVAIFAFRLPFPLIVFGAGLAGFAANRVGLVSAEAGHNGTTSDNQLSVMDAIFARGMPQHVQPSFSRFVKIALIGAAVWLGPLAVLLLWVGPENVFSAIGLFNSKMAVVTFGGAYAVLAYMAQQAVEHYHWLKPGEMLVGLGFAETTPGPLICVVEFVGFMAAFRHPGALDPALAGILGGLLAMWSTFVPPFIWIFLGGPYVEMLIGNEAIKAALSAITAAVVGVILNLAVWSGLHTLFGQVVETSRYGLHVSLPVLSTVNLPILFLSLAAIVAQLKFKLGLFRTLALCSVASLSWYLIQ
jgi:chromate transporter